MTTSEDSSPWAEVASPLGELLIHFNSVEASVGSMIATLLKQTWPVGSIFSAVLNFAQKVKLTEMLLEVTRLPPELITECREVIGDARKLNSFRNRAVHSEYYVHFKDDEKPHLWRMHRDSFEPVEGFEGVLAPAYSEFNTGEIVKAADKARTLILRIESLEAEIAGRLR